MLRSRHRFHRIWRCRRATNPVVPFSYDTLHPGQEHRRCATSSLDERGDKAASSWKISTVRRSTEERSRAWGRATAPAWRTRSSALRDKKAAPAVYRTVRRGYGGDVFAGHELVPCRRTCSSRFTGRSRAWSMWRSCAAPMRSNTTAWTPCRWKPRSNSWISPACTVRGSSTAAPAMRRPPRRAWLRASTRRSRSRARNRWFWTARAPTSGR